MDFAPTQRCTKADLGAGALKNPAYYALDDWLKKLSIFILLPAKHMLPILGTSFEFFLLSTPDKRT